MSLPALSPVHNISLFHGQKWLFGAHGIQLWLTVNFFSVADATLIVLGMENEIGPPELQSVSAGQRQQNAYEQGVEYTPSPASYE